MNVSDFFRLLELAGPNQQQRRNGAELLIYLREFRIQLLQSKLFVFTGDFRRKARDGVRFIERFAVAGIGNDLPLFAVVGNQYLILADKGAESRAGIIRRRRAVLRKDDALNGFGARKGQRLG